MNPVFNNIAAQISCLNKIEGKKSESAWKLSTNSLQVIKQIGQNEAFFLKPYIYFKSQQKCLFHYFVSDICVYFK